MVGEVRTKINIMVALRVIHRKNMRTILMEKISSIMVAHHKKAINKMALIIHNHMKLKFQIKELPRMTNSITNIHSHTGQIQTEAANNVSNTVMRHMTITHFTMINMKITSMNRIIRIVTPIRIRIDNRPHLIIKTLVPNSIPIATLSTTMIIKSITTLAIQDLCLISSTINITRITSILNIIRTPEIKDIPNSILKTQQKAIVQAAKRAKTARARNHQWQHAKPILKATQTTINIARQNTTQTQKAMASILQIKMEIMARVSEETTCVMYANQTSKMLKRSFIHATVSIKYVMRATIIKSITKKENVQIAGSIMR